jgi:hypothetical protein
MSASEMKIGRETDIPKSVNRAMGGAHRPAVDHEPLDRFFRAASTIHG